MRRSVAALAIAVGAVTLSPASAADGGKFGDALRVMLSGTAAGQCPADVMGDALLAACREQLPALQSSLAAAGAIKAMTFVAATGGDADRIETYTVTFEKGPPTTWQIGHPNNGKFDMAYSAG
ncbi:hypothetical protein [Sphingomonas carotinifaciens]|uniref:Uncharacterized protein n=1 Tax=Sphingomonas carotinifaciens TaxID=1166323 RepID=A0A1G7LGL3_9SPHN|nr:hypothetical protein [Sphingomonas carotinifaciens]MBB4085639.1 hypothetical protein [Sphingomonas carotinifaciens]MWC43343.1 hypothetical protein [Sphingomonas carotinifaciens]SDF48561.1 hypothetical protein SAMN05216557_103485 [Sphingomonas carotinifaciens]